MQSIIFPLTLSTLAGLSTLIGAIFIFFKIQDKNLNKFISFCLAFSISVMITISILDLIFSNIKYLWSREEYFNFDYCLYYKLHCNNIFKC